MKLTFRGQYKSLNSFEWSTSAKLNIITGKNGSGKTQLLELLNTVMSPNIPNENKYPFRSFDTETKKEKTIWNFIKLDDLDAKYQGLVYWHAQGKSLISHSVDYNYYMQFINWLYISTKLNDIELSNKLGVNSVENFVPNNTRSMSGFESLVNGYYIKDKIFQHFETTLKINASQIEYWQLLCHLPLHLIFEYSQFNAPELVEFYIFFYYMQKVMREYYGIETETLGEDPIEVLNKTINASGLKIEVQKFDIEVYRSAKGIEAALKVIPSYVLLAKKVNSSEYISFNNFSSGERAIISLGFLEYYSNYFNKKPSLLLLDELDAHLHPALIPNFFRVVNELLIEQYHSTVIMTTHNPSTIALAPKSENCKVFQLSNEPFTQLIEDNSTGKNDSVTILTEGLVVVNEKTKYIFVEDEDDVRFYTNFNAITKASKNLVFLPASTRLKKQEKSGEEKFPGGKNEVQKLADKLQPVMGIFGGIVDRDSGTIRRAENLSTIERYSIENYLFDPLVLFAFLQSKKSNLTDLASFNVPVGAEREISSNLAERISAYFLSKLEPFVLAQITADFESKRLNYSLPIANIDECKEKFILEFTNGNTAEYPSWLLYYRGKDLYQIFHKVFNLHPTNIQLLEYYNRIGNFPIELVAMLQDFK